ALHGAMADPTWLPGYDRVVAHQDSSRSEPPTWCEVNCPDLQGKSIAYFSAEFALHQSLPIYAGGLRVLAVRHARCRRAVSGCSPASTAKRPAISAFRWSAWVSCIRRATSIRA